MKQFRFKKAVSFLLAIAITGATAICNSTVIAPLAPITAQAASKASITLNMKKTTMYVGESDTLSVKKVKGLKSKAVTFKSSKSSVVAVNSKGKISAKKSGTAKITVTSKSNKTVKSVCTITVKNAPSTKKINLENEYSTRINLFDTYQINVLSVEGVSTTDVKYTSSDSQIATVDKNGVVTGLSRGKVEITITSVRNPQVKKTFTVNVASGTGNEYLSTEDFDISGFYNGGITYNGKVYDNYIDFVDAGGQGNYLVTYMQEGKDFTSDGDWKTFQTNRGIKFGDSLEDVVKAYNNVYWYYGTTSFKEFNTEEHVCTHVLSFSTKTNEKLDFYIDKNNTVMAIAIGKIK